MIIQSRSSRTNNRPRPMNRQTVPNQGTSSDHPNRPTDSVDSQQHSTIDAAAVAKISSQYSDDEIVPGELIVKLSPQKDSTLATFADEYGATIAEHFDIPKNMLDSFDGELVRMKLPAGLNYADAMAAMKSDERVQFAEPNLVFRLDENAPSLGQESPPNSQENTPDDLDEKLWGLHNTGQTGGTAGADVSAKQAWVINKGDDSDKGPLIAVIDSGIDYNHPDLKSNMWVNPGEIAGDGIDNDGNGVIDDVHGYNAFADSGDPMDWHSHGTHCAGTIAAVGDNGQGVTGVMQQANLMAVKIFSDSGSTSTDAIVRGILYSAKMGAEVTSNSWGGKRRSEAIYEAFKSHQGLHVVAAGNSAYDNDKRDNFPSNYELDNIVAVAATNHIDQRAGFSQWGATKVDVAAPGARIYSTIPGGRFGVKSGTSMATPHVSGGAGLILSEFPEATNAEVKNRLIYGSDRMPSMLGVSVSNGRVNFANSLENDQQAPGTPNDFEISQIHTRGGQVTWTSVGDDQWANGPAQLVEMRSSSTPITDENFEDATRHSLDGAEEVGDLASFPFKAQTSETETPVYFAMRSVDNVGNMSKTSFAAGIIPAADVVMSDDFDGQQTTFQAAGDFHRSHVKGRGQVFSNRAPGDGASPESSLTSQSIDLSKSSNATLRFDYKSDLLFGERATVFASTDGENWIRQAFLKKFTDWREQTVDISEFDGQQVQLRVLVDSRDGSRSAGISIDNLRVLAETVG